MALQIEENKDLKLIVIEQVYGDNSLSTYNLNMRYSNHKQTIYDWGLTMGDILHIKGCKQLDASDRSGRRVQLTFVEVI